MSDQLFGQSGDGSYSGTTENIRVSVVPAPAFKNSDPAEDLYAFSYSIKIENLGSETVQLLERHWIILSDGQQIAEVVGPGVVGVQPVIEAGRSFEYSSGAVIHHPQGSMHGSYTFKTESGRYVDVPIPRFDLIYPVIMH